MIDKKSFRSLVLAPATTALLATGAHAGGLADAIVETPQVEIMPEDDDTGLANWVVPAIALLVIGIAVASSGDDDDDDEVEEDTTPTTLSSILP